MELELFNVASHDDDQDSFTCENTSLNDFQFLLRGVGFEPTWGF
jgi:hypothetical protein